MCLDLLYRNSESEFQVDFSYLAVKDKILVNKVFETESEINGINYGGYFDNYLWMRLEDSNGEPLITTLINYYDMECDWEDPTSFWKTLQGQLTQLSNDVDGDDLIYNCMEMFWDATIISGFHETYIGNLINESMEEVASFYIRTVDFGMHLPSELEIHPFYDT